MNRKPRPVGSYWILRAGGVSKQPRVEHRSDGATTFDELHVNALNLHIEQMDTRCWWMQVGDACLSIMPRRDGTVVVNVERGAYGPVCGETTGGGAK